MGLLSKKLFTGLVLGSSKMPTNKQMAYLKKHNIKDVPSLLTKAKAAKIIEDDLDRRFRAPKTQVAKIAAQERKLQDKRSELQLMEQKLLEEQKKQFAADLARLREKEEKEKTRPKEVDRGLS